MTAALPVWRSLLYVPATIQKYIDKAHMYGADCIQLDLEDSVPESEKARARGGIASVARRLRERGVDVVVRINRPFAMAVRDIEAVVTADVALGSEDFALNVGMRPTEETLLMPKQQMIFAAASAGLMPLGFIESVANYRDIEAFRIMVHRSRDFGFVGAGCVHPSQVPIVNEAYSPTADEVDKARRVVAESQVAESKGRGAFAMDESMIDRPIVLRAKRLLDRHAAIEARASHSPSLR